MIVQLDGPGAGAVASAIADLFANVITDGHVHTCYNADGEEKLTIVFDGTDLEVDHNVLVVAPAATIQNLIDEHPQRIIQIYLNEEGDINEIHFGANYCTAAQAQGLIEEAFNL